MYTDDVAATHEFPRVDVARRDVARSTALPCKRRESRPRLKGAVSLLRNRRTRRLAQQDRGNPKVLARSGEVPLLELPLGPCQDLLDVRHEREPASLEELHALPRQFNGLCERLSGVRPAGKRMEGPLEVLDRARVVRLPDEPTRVADRDFRLVRLEAFRLEPAVQDLGIGEAERRLAVGACDRLDLSPQAGRYCRGRVDDPFLEGLPRGSEFPFRAVREDP